MIWIKKNANGKNVIIRWQKNQIKCSEIMAISYPVDTDLINCPQCSKEINLKHIRQKVEQESGKKVI